MILLSIRQSYIQKNELNLVSFCIRRILHKNTAALSAKILYLDSEAVDVNIRARSLQRCR
jgi:hypothetical protein